MFTTKHNIIWEGHRENTTGLWNLPLQKHPSFQNLKQIPQHGVFSAYSMTTK